MADAWRSPSFAGNVAIVAAALYGPQASVQFSTFFAATGLPALEPPAQRLAIWIPDDPDESTSVWTSLEDEDDGDE